MFVYLVQGLFAGVSDDGVLSVELLLRQPVHDGSHALLRAQGHDAEALGPTIGPVFKEFHFDEVGHAGVADRVGYVLVACPL